MDIHLVFKDSHVTELALFGHGPDEPLLVSLVVLAGEYRHPALSTVIFILPLTLCLHLSLRLPLRCLVAGEVSQPRGSGGELKDGVSQQKPESAFTYLGWTVTAVEIHPDIVVSSVRKVLTVVSPEFLSVLEPVFV